MRKRPRGDSRRKSRTNAATAESRNPVLASATSADPDGSPSKTMGGAVAVIAATPSDGAVRSACGSDSAVSSDNRDSIPKEEVARRAPYPFIAYPGFRGDAEARSAPPQGGGHRSLPVLGPRHPHRGDGPRRWIHREEDRRGRGHPARDVPESGLHDLLVLPRGLDGDGCSRYPPRPGRAKAGRRGHHDLRHRGSRPGPGLETILPWRLRHG